MATSSRLVVSSPRDKKKVSICISCKLPVISVCSFSVDAVVNGAERLRDVDTVQKFLEDHQNNR